MWFARFLQLIDRSPLGAAVAKRRDLLRSTGEPARIYVENVRSFFGLPTGVAKLLCEIAVNQGMFERCIAILCPNDSRVLTDICGDEELQQENVSCEVCESLERPHVFPTNECRRLPFYRLRHADA